MVFDVNRTVEATDIGILINSTYTLVTSQKWDILSHFCFDREGFRHLGATN